MHYSWLIAREGLNPEDVPEKEGVYIDWTHNGNHANAIAAAQAMVRSYHIVYQPVLVSRHTQRRAIDMTIINVIGKTLKNSAGVDIVVRTESTLYNIGATYGVHKLISDAPHWSDDGH